MTRGWGPDGARPPSAVRSLHAPSRPHRRRRAARRRHRPRPPDGGRGRARADAPSSTSLSVESRWLRFFSAGADLHRAASYMAALEPERGRGLVAVAGEPERIVAHAAYIREQDPQRAEVAFEVADDWQGRGIATVLLAHLSELATAEGIETFTATVLPENHRMIQVFRDSGFAVEVESRPGELPSSCPPRSGRRRERASRSATRSPPRPPSPTSCGPRRSRSSASRAARARSARRCCATCARPASSGRLVRRAPARDDGRRPAGPPLDRRRPGARGAGRDRGSRRVRRGRRAPVRRRRRARARGALGRLRRGRTARSRPPGRAARRLPRQRHAARRPELPRRAQHRPGRRR